jgi:hypothetical protein
VKIIFHESIKKSREKISGKMKRMLYEQIYRRCGAKKFNYLNIIFLRKKKLRANEIENRTVSKNPKKEKLKEKFYLS